MNDSEISNMFEEKIKENNNQIINTVLFDVRKLTRKLENQISNLSVSLGVIKNETEEHMKHLLENMDFVKEVENRLSYNLEKHLHKILSDSKISKVLLEITKSSIRTNLGDSIKQVTNTILNSISKRLKVELNIVKDLTYSIDSEIKHTIRHNEVSYELGQRIDKKINVLLDKVKVTDDNKLMIENEHKEVLK